MSHQYGNNFGDWGSGFILWGSVIEMYCHAASKKEAIRLFPFAVKRYANVTP